VQDPARDALAARFGRRPHMTTAPFDLSGNRHCTAIQLLNMTHSGRGCIAKARVARGG
jgi:hypothetical protein